MKILDILKGITGTYEINRVVGAAGAATYIVGAHVFQAWDILYNHQPFNLVAYCAAFPGGLAIAVGAIATATAVKDRAVAAATVVQNTGAQPGAAT